MEERNTCLNNHFYGFLKVAVFPSPLVYIEPKHFNKQLIEDVLVQGLKHFS